MDNLKVEREEATLQDKFNYYGDFVQLPLLLLADFYYLVEYASIDIPVIISFFAGLLVYGACIEYGFHRFVYHGGLKQIKKMHLIHHKFPQSYVSSPPYVTSVIMCVFYVFFIGIFGSKLGCAIVAGITFGYLWYIIIHHLIHHVAESESGFLSYFQKEHQNHHEHAKNNFCVSQPFWNSFYRVLSKLKQQLTT